MKRCCMNCFHDAVIRKFIAELGQVGDCDYCESHGVSTGNLATVGDFVREGLKSAYGNADGVQITDARDYRHFRCSSAAKVLEHEAGIVPVSCERKLAYDLLTSFTEASLEQDWCWPQSPYDSVARHRDFLVLDGLEEANTFSASWEYFKCSVMHNSRFFGIGDDKETMIEGIARLFPTLESRLTAGDVVYRARVAEGWLPADPWEIQSMLGPPPMRKAKNSRMSPPGISYCYVSGDPDTCVAEIRPNVGSEAWVARFVILRDIKLLDLSALPEIEMPSIFSADYDSSLDWANYFFSAFIAEVSQPPQSTDDPLEYIPTQVLAEYIRAQGYNGIAYKSSQTAGGVNYTLFCRPDPYSDTEPSPQCPQGRPMFHEWLRIEEVNTVRIEALRLEIFRKSALTIDANGLIPPYRLED